MQQLAIALQCLSQVGLDELEDLRLDGVEQVEQIFADPVDGVAVHFAFFFWVSGKGYLEEKWRGIKCVVGVCCLPFRWKLMGSGCRRF